MDEYEEQLEEQFPPDEQFQMPESGRPKRRWLKWVRRLFTGTLILAVLLVVAFFVVVELAKVEPEFYRKALSVDEQQQKQNGSEMETKLLDLWNSVLAAESWTATFSEDQINGWLAWDLKNRFPELIPPEVHEPRVSLNDKSVTLAFWCDVKPFRGVAIISADVFLTGVLNEVGVRVQSIHSGKIPIPLATIADQITAQARKSGIEVEWQTDGTDSVAIFQLPDAMVKPSGGGLLEFQKLEFAPGQLTIAGVSHPPDY